MKYWLWSLYLQNPITKDIFHVFPYWHLPFNFFCFKTQRLSYLRLSLLQKCVQYKPVYIPLCVNVEIRTFCDHLTPRWHNCVSNYLPYLHILCKVPRFFCVPFFSVLGRSKEIFTIKITYEKICFLSHQESGLASDTLWNVTEKNFGSAFSLRHKNCPSWWEGWV